MRGLGQLVGMGVTAIVVLGNDLDVMIAVPLGVFAGAIAVGIVGALEAKFAKPKEA